MFEQAGGSIPMHQENPRLIQGVIPGSFIGAGAGFVVFWHIITSATNAGAMVDVQFHHYHADPAWQILLGGGFLMIAAALIFLAITWRSPGSSRS